MADRPLFTEACLETAFPRTERREALAVLNNRLHPALQKIVAAEVASGNRVVDVGIDWPDAGSVHVTLHRHFTDRHASEDAAFSLCDDPHYWHADYSTAEKPRHLLIC
ncbi:hypothetical protein [Acidovorax cavernicola]|uniref:Uncharacterized protein n=1 Tax=Acidovorax cavernicola TaxID=1675792 RepID=A0A9X8D1L9_9BURK|nr:hypothetical protein [Acidovorax cavernicola]RIX76303.1 hypothetical protein D3H34_22405 [Acidovorax cavernicola]